MQRVSTSRMLLLSALVASLCALAACRGASGAVSETASSQAGDLAGLVHEADQPGIARAGEGRYGDETDVGVTLPADFPADVFLPEQRTISSALDMGETKAVNVATGAALAQVSAEVEQGMQALGWTREMAMQSNTASATLIYTKDKRQAVYQMIRADSGGTRLAVRTGDG